MNKANSIQRSKLFSSYGGVGSTIDTIDNLSYLISPFDTWNIYRAIDHRPAGFAHLKINEERLKARLNAIGFTQLNEFFSLDDFKGEEIKPWNIQPSEEARMVNCSYFPRWFYCPKCHRFQPIDTWRESGTNDKAWGNNPPSCSICNISLTGNRFKRSYLQQVRFVMASLETGEIADIPWNQVFTKRGTSDSPMAPVWLIDDNTPRSETVYFYMTKGSSDLTGIYVKDNIGHKITMAEIMEHYFVITDANGRSVAYHPVIRNANNVYFAYNLSSLYVPKCSIKQTDVDAVQNYFNGLPVIFRNNPAVLATVTASDIKTSTNSRLSIKQIQTILNTSNAPGTGYSIPPATPIVTEEAFREEEFDYITDLTQYDSNSKNNQCYELEAEIFNKTCWASCPNYISKLILLRKLTVTTVQAAYSRIDKIGIGNLQNWEGNSDKQWLDIHSMAITKTNNVKLRPTCNAPINSITRMPAVQATGEGFFIELDLSRIGKLGDKKIYLHTFCHLIMKELEFSCGYPLASMNERLYFLPDPNDSTKGKFGFLIYSASGEVGSYGGISSLFQSNKIVKIIEMAIELANDCPNDPICETEKGHCFACVDVPETACEEFNSLLDRNIFRKYL